MSCSTPRPSLISALWAWGTIFLLLGLLVGLETALLTQSVSLSLLGKSLAAIGVSGIIRNLIKKDLI